MKSVRLDDHRRERALYSPDICIWIAGVSVKYRFGNVHLILEFSTDHHPIEQVFLPANDILLEHRGVSR
jgi:hypothetical protein